MLDRLMANPHPAARGIAYENVYSYLIWRAFADEGQPLNRAFKFIHMAPDGQTRTAERGIAACIGHKANSEADTLAWFAGQSDRVPILQPDENFGPDLANGALLPGGREVLLLHQLKYWNSRKSSTLFREAVWKLSPDGVYASCRENFEQLKPHLEPFTWGGDVPMPPALKTKKKKKKKAQKTFKYSARKPEYAMIRIFAAFEGTFVVPDLDASFGRYPIAVLSDELTRQGFLQFPAFRHAVEKGKRLAEEAKKGKGKGKKEQT